MKKQIVILLSVVTLLTGLSACSKSTTDSSTDKKAKQLKSHPNPKKQKIVLKKRK